jgi:NADH-quinone oxidoreductase subunit H
MSEILRGILAFLVWPGLLSAVILAWFYLWLGRKVTARLQGRQGPPFFQPFFDFVKLLGKKTVRPAGVNMGLFFGLPLVSLVSVLAALALIPAPGASSISFSGDLIFLLYLLEMPALVDIFAGFISHSVYAQVGAVREALLSLGHNLPFIIAFIALAMQAKSSNLQTIVATHFSPVQILAALALILAIPARVKANPFSIPNAETEIVAGTHIEFNGPALGIFELVHGLEIVALSGLLAGLFSGLVSGFITSLLVYLAVSIAVVMFTSLLAASTARVKVQYALGFYWRWGALAAALAIVAAIL